MQSESLYKATTFFSPEFAYIPSQHWSLVILFSASIVTGLMAEIFFCMNTLGSADLLKFSG